MSSVNEMLFNTCVQTNSTKYFLQGQEAEVMHFLNCLSSECLATNVEICTHQAQ